MHVLGLITARGGSKGIPHKNLAPCGGRPLLAWTCAAALGAHCLTRTIISTDDPDLAALATREGVEAPFLRPAPLATDTAKSIDVARHAIGALAEQGWHTDVLVLLQPTSPLRTSRHIDEAFALLADGVEAVVSVIEVPHQFKPWVVMTREGDYLRDYEIRELPFDKFRRQGQPILYARNGPAVVVTRAATIAAGSFYGERCVPYPMPVKASIDIDDRDDLALADQWLRGA